MATTAQSILDKAEIILQDTENDRWSPDDLFTWLNEGEQIIVMVKPDANAVISSVNLASGSEQSLTTLASTAIQLLDATYNMGTDGTTVGDAVTIVNRGIMDACYPGWRAGSSNVSVKHVIYDPKIAPKTFWVYPKSDGTNYLEIITANLPAAISGLNSNINLADEYAPILQQYVLFKAFSTDVEYADVNQAALYQQMFMAALGLRDKAETLFKPQNTPRGD